MIASHQQGFVFVKSRKTAGTSVEIALSAVCGPQDVISEILPDDEAIRRDLGFRSAQNTQLPLRACTARDLARCVVRRRRPRYWNHMPAHQICRALGPTAWEQMYTFTVERNPWDRAVSLYYWRTQNRSVREDFSTFLRSVDIDRLSNFSVYANNGSVSVDRVLRYEQLADELADVWSRLGLPGEPMNVHAKSGQRPSTSRDYRAQYTDDDAAYIAGVCAREIALLDYTFDPR